MNGNTARLMRKASGGSLSKYRQLKAAYTQSSRDKRHAAKLQMRDLAELERQHRILKEGQHESGE